MSTPPDTTSGTGQYSDALASELSDFVSLTQTYFPADCANPAPFLRAALSTGREETDVVHVQFDYVLFGPVGLYTLFFLPLLWIQSRRFDFALVVTMHEVLNGKLVGPPLVPLKKLYTWVLNTVVAQTADSVVFLSGEAEKRFTDSVGAGTYRQVPHGANREDIRTLAPAEAKDHFGYTAETQLVVLPGYVSPRKGSDLFCALADRCPDIEFLLAGGPPRERHTSFYESIRSRAPSNLQVTGHLEADAFHAAFAAADIVVLPYNETEQTGVVNAVNQSGVFNWCAAYGVPVLASDCARFRTLQDEWDAVALFDGTDLDDAERVMRELLVDKTKRDQLSANIERYGTVNSLTAAAEAHQSLYREFSS